MRKCTWIPLMLLVALSSLEASRDNCRTFIEQGVAGSGGPKGPTGPTGAGGVTKSDPHLFVMASAQFINPSSPVVFSNGLVSAGTAITWDNVSTFTFHQTGDYLVSFVYYTSTLDVALATPGYKLYVNGSPVGINAPSYTNNSLTATGVLQEIIHISSAPSTAQVVNIDTQALNLGFQNAAATISFVQLTTP